MQAASTDLTAQHNLHEKPSSADSWLAANGSCPDDCHYCSGPETD